MPALRSYQTAVLDDLERVVEDGKRRIVVVAPTGAGKTVIASEIVRRGLPRAEGVLVLAHRRELISQTAAKLLSFGVDCGIIQSGISPRPGEPVQVAGVQTLWARAMRTRRIELPPAGLVIVDEAHHIRARTYQKIIEAYPSAIVLGLTATPCRGDGRGLGNAFEAMVLCPQVAELVRQGFLVPTRVYAPTRPDLKGVHVRHGDYVEAQLAERMDDAKLTGDIVSHWLRLSERRKTVVFASSVAHSVHLRDEFRRAGVMAEHIDGSTSIAERESILAQLSAGKVDVVTNCMVLTEGWDQPDVGCLVLARPTKHMGLYRQMVGRVLRPSPGKSDAIILDHAGAVFEHGFVDENVIWTLDADTRAINPAQKARAAGRVSALATCPECGAVRMSGRPCTACGWQARPRGAPVEVADGELAHVDRQRRAQHPGYTDAQLQTFHAMLAYIADEKGYKPGWVAHKFKEKFGAWPETNKITPIKPDDATRAWVRSRQIAYAKALQAKGAA